MSSGMSAFTPDTASVKAAYCVAGTAKDARISYSELYLEGLPQYGAEFDRWLAEHDERVKVIGRAELRAAIEEMCEDDETYGTDAWMSDLRDLLAVDGAGEAKS